MRKVLFVLAFLISSVFAESQVAAIPGYCTLGASQAMLSGMNSTNYQQGIVPFCTVTVYLTGTITPATIYATSTLTPLSNPFTASNLGYWQFYASSASGYDVVLSGGIAPNSYTNPVTITDAGGVGLASSIFSTSNNWTALQNFNAGLTAQSVNGVINAAFSSGGTVAAQLTAAIASCASTSCPYVYVPSSMGPGWWTPPIPNNVSVWDYRTGVLQIFTGANNANGGSVGLAVYANAQIGVSFPPVNPPANNPVAIYAEISSASGGNTIEAMNPLTNVVAGKDASSVTLEADNGNQGSDVSDPWAINHKIGVQATTGGTVPSTAAFFADSSGTGGVAGWHYGFMADVILGTQFTSSNRRAVVTSSAITANASAQSVPLTYATQITGGTYMSVDSGANHEDVKVVSSTIVPATVTAIFAKNHTIGIGMSFYSGQYGMAYPNQIFQVSPLLLCSIADYYTTGTPSTCNMAVKDVGGTIQYPMTFNSSNQTVYADLGGGWSWQSETGTVYASLTNGTFTATNPTLKAASGTYAVLSAYDNAGVFQGALDAIPAASSPVPAWPVSSVVLEGQNGNTVVSSTGATGVIKITPNRVDVMDLTSTSITFGLESPYATYLACYTTGGKQGHCTTPPSGTPPTCGCSTP